MTPFRPGGSFLFIFGWGNTLWLVLLFKYDGGDGCLFSSEVFGGCRSICLLCRWDDKSVEMVETLQKWASISCLVRIESS